MKTMSVSRIALIALIALVALWPVGNAYAHHSGVATYDYRKTVKLTGIVVEYKLRSPHAHILMDVKNAAGAVERWTVEAGAVGTLKRQGLDKDKVKPGDVITVVAAANRNPERRLVWLNKITTADGTVVGGTFKELIEAGIPKPAKPGSHAAAVGIEKLAGRWDLANFDPTKFQRSKTPLPLTPAGQEAVKKYDPRRSPNLDCTPASLPWLWDLPYLHDFKVRGQEVIIRHELFNITLTVPLNGKPKKVDKAGLFGLVSGRIEGDDLVVDSSGYPASRWGLAGSGSPLGAQKDIPSSAQKKVTERYSVSDDGNTITVAYTVSDPVYLTKPYSETVTLHRVADDTPMDFTCDRDSANRFLK